MPKQAGQPIQPDGGLVDQIHEKVSNLEFQANKNLIKNTITEFLINQSDTEAKLRASTITFKHGDQVTHVKILENIEVWVKSKNKPMPTVWLDKSFTYANFGSAELKASFASSAISLDESLNAAMGCCESTTEAFHRKLVKLEISAVRPSFKFDTVKRIVKNYVGENSVEDFREGKPFGPIKARHIMFKGNAEAVRKIFMLHEGAINYHCYDTRTRGRLHIRISAKPFMCRACFQMGYHPNCPGKLCAQCGNKGHLTKDCKAKLKFCTNCRKRGHRARDSHCPSYLAEVCKEIKKMDVPIEFYQDSLLRVKLVKYLLVK